MKNRKKSLKWERARSVQCPKCGAVPGHPCRIEVLAHPTERRYEMMQHHQERYEASRRFVTETTQFLSREIDRSPAR